MQANVRNISPDGATGAEHRLPAQWARRHGHAWSVYPTILLLLLFVGNTAGAFGPVGEVTGLSLEMITPLSQAPCDELSAGRRGCLCCRWNSGSQVNADWVNVFVMPDLSLLRGGYAFTCSVPGIITDQTVCCQSEFLLPGKVTGFLAQGANPSGVGPLGFDSSGRTIPPANICP